jgi:alkanesulfonate monooxygenase SsuD/methylene tetrahydromethanopterin reductase-like flavin-dependent oxidoreductase (luciferase family)
LTIIDSMAKPFKIGIFDHMDRGSDDTAAFYAQRLALTELYDRSGFYSYHVAEHHSTPLGLAPSPNVYLSMVAGRTQRLRIGALVYLLPFYHPLRLLEELCMLDQMSGGRLDAGIGRGVSPVEARFHDVDPKTSQAVFEESLEVLLAGFATRQLTFDGDFFHFDNIPIEMTPYQQPRPPLWYGVTSAESAERWARRGFNILTSTGPDEAAAVLKPHRAIGRASSPELLAGIIRYIVVADTDAAALEIAEAAYPRWYNSFHTLFRKYGTGPVYGARPTTFAGTIENGSGIAGSPETVLRMLEAHARRTDCNYIVGQFAFGDMKHADAARSIELFAREVMPRLLEREPAKR